MLVASQNCLVLEYMCCFFNGFVMRRNCALNSENDEIFFAFVFSSLGNTQHYQYDSTVP